MKPISTHPNAGWGARNIGVILRLPSCVFVSICLSGWKSNNLTFTFDYQSLYQSLSNERLIFLSSQNFDSNDRDIGEEYELVPTTPLTQVELKLNHFYHSGQTYTNAWPAFLWASRRIKELVKQVKNYKTPLLCAFSGQTIKCPQVNKWNSRRIHLSTEPQKKLW